MTMRPEWTQDGENYERLRRRLIYFFERRGSRRAEEIVDEALFRVLKNFGDKTPEDIGAYAYRVAQHVWQEWHRRETRESPLDDSPAAPPGRSTSGNQSMERQILTREVQRAVNRLEPGLWSLLSAYYEKGPARLAAELGVNPQSLRVWAHRQRKRIHSLLRNLPPDCTSSETDVPGNDS